METTFTEEQAKAVEKLVMEAKLKVIKDFKDYLGTINFDDESWIQDDWMEEYYKYFKACVIRGNETEMVNEAMELEAGEYESD